LTPGCKKLKPISVKNYNKSKPKIEMNTSLLFVFGVLFVAVGGLLVYWLLVITEGVFLGRRIVVWLYDVTAERYDGIKQFDPLAEQFFVVRPLLARQGGGPAPLVLDVATGTGRFPHFLLEEATFNGRIIGLDASARMLALASAKLQPYGHRASLVQQTAAHLPFSEAVFDTVSCLEALEFFPNDSEALRDMFRVLQPGGLLMVTRRRGWEGKAFLGRYRSSDKFKQHLQNIGLEAVEMIPWQVEYDLVFAQKPVHSVGLEIYSDAD
jgi:ubiquinone/menaquinone biosynthesis C-methylase UbiE